MSKHVLWSGLSHCFDANGNELSCHGTGQDGEFSPGIPWPEPRFIVKDNALVHDKATDLLWMRDANPFSYPMSWQEGLEVIDRLNEEQRFGRKDWRLPNRRELRSLISHGARKPALPEGHPFANVFLGWYWTSTTSALANRYAWYVHMEGGRMFYGRKDSSYLIWPVCGESSILPRTGQTICYDERGAEIPCGQCGQDGALLQGRAWPEPRFIIQEEGVLDKLTGLLWHRQANITGSPATWNEALETVLQLVKRSNLPWRLPTINELESLVDASSHSPALAEHQLFSSIQQAYWSSTTSFFEPDWAYVLYLHKGAVGVGYKQNSDFYLWPVLEQRIQ